MLPYFSSGFVLVHNTKNLFESWLSLYRQLKDRSDLIENLYHTDQISLALAVHKERYTFQLWPATINAPLGFLDYRPSMRAVHWFNLEVLRQQHSLVPEFRKHISAIVLALRDQDGIDLTRAVLRAPAPVWRRLRHRAREFARRTKWRLQSIGYGILSSR
jgi:hypothetical protein